MQPAFGWRIHRLLQWTCIIYYNFTGHRSHRWWIFKGGRNFFLSRVGQLYNGFNRPGQCFIVSSHFNRIGQLYYRFSLLSLGSSVFWVFSPSILVWWFLLFWHVLLSFNSPAQGGLDSVIVNCRVNAVSVSCWLANWPAPSRLLITWSYPDLEEMLSFLVLMGNGTFYTLLYTLDTVDTVDAVDTVK